MTGETQHLIYWWFVWLKRLLLTTYHIFNRKAYRKWKKEKNQKQNNRFHRGCSNIDPNIDNEWDFM